MKTHVTGSSIFLTGKAWEIRHKLQRLVRKDALKHATLHMYLQTITPVEKRAVEPIQP
ncbi:Z-ring formation inhibitor MciZ [Paenibacillus turpanensis]|uniref:Z-ring formation inhibitor MciZ n=1 Tax=Paenibacillus turpanensis TaxID=2689078 RepID=UPI00140C2BA0|nr:Z-ring formation inhibitor MciZ [Paenibacillus turpanensis]